VNRSPPRRASSEADDARKPDATHDRGMHERAAARLLSQLVVTLGVDMWARQRFEAEDAACAP
jgi:hypothetical protein